MDPIFTTLANSLRELGLGQLFTVTNGQPGGWLWDQIQQGVDTGEELALAIQQTDVFRQRFGVIIEQQRRAAAGEPVYVMSPAEVIEYETRARQIMSAAGMPEWFYDQPNDFHSAILNDISLQELEERVVETFEYVDNAPPEVRQAFTEYFGVGQAQQALAAFVLDPQRTTAQLERARRTAYAGGMAKRFNVTISEQQAARIAELPMTEAGITEGLTQVAQQSPLLREGMFEATDITNDDGIAAVFEGNAAAQTALQRRQIERTASSRASAGGAALTQQGLVGAGSA